MLFLSKPPPCESMQIFVGLHGSCNAVFEVLGFVGYVMQFSKGHVPMKLLFLEDWRLDEDDRHSCQTDLIHLL